MYWLLPRSHPGALTTHERAGVRFSCAQNHSLPHGPAARLLMVWMHLEGPAHRGRRAAARALARSVRRGARPRRRRRSPSRPSRLCACTVSQEDWACPIATHARRSPAPRRFASARRFMRRFRAHRLEVSLPCLRELSGIPELLDPYLRKCYTREYYRLDFTMPSTRAMLRHGSLMRMLYLTFSEVWAASARRPCSAWKELYQEFAEPPSPEPTERELLRVPRPREHRPAHGLHARDQVPVRRTTGMQARSLVRSLKARSGSPGPAPGDPGPDAAPSGSG